MGILTQVAENVWRAETVFRIGPAFSMPVASVITRDSAGKITIISPIPFTDEQTAAINTRGPVVALVTPNQFHHLSLPKAIERWPNAKVWAAPGLPEKRKDIHFDAVLGTGSDILNDYDTLFLEGTKRAAEIIFFHRPSRSLIIADLIFNIPNDPSLGWIGRLYLRFSHALDKPGSSLFWRILIRNRIAAAASFQQILSFDFVRVLPAHGNVIETNARSTVEKVLRRMV